MGVTGASGAIYAQRFLQQAALRYPEVLLIMSEQAFQVARTELGISLHRETFDAGKWLGPEAAHVRLLSSKDYFTPPASGSYRHDGMVIVPSSMGTAGRIANGISDDLLTRSAEVCLKERRPLILVPREMPWSLVSLRNMTALAEAGATIMPACPAWYHKPQTLEDLADTVVARILQLLGWEQDLQREWMA